MPNFHGSMSYIDSVIDIILDNILTYFDLKYCNMTFDEEGSSFTVIVQPYNTFILSERNTIETHAYDIDAPDLFKQLIEDIEKSLEEWIAFNIFEEPDTDEYKSEYDNNKKSYTKKYNKSKICSNRRPLCHIRH